MTISVIMVNYFSSALIANSIKSLISNQYDIQIIIVDNSNSNTEKKALLSLNDKRCEIIFNDENRGFGSACNLALTKSVGDYILLLNPDTYLHKQALDIMAEALKKSTAIGAVSPQPFWDLNFKFYLPQLQMHSPLRELLNVISFRSILFKNILSNYIFKKNIEAFISSTPVEQTMLSGGHIMIKKDIIEQIGGLFDTHFFMYYEDTDLSFRIKKSGYSLLLVPDAKVTHFWENSPSKNEHQSISKEYFYTKHFRFLSLFKLLKKLLEKLPLKDPKIYKNFGTIHKLPDLNSYINPKIPSVVEVGFHYTFVPSVIIFLDRDERLSFEPIENYLSTGEYWLQIRQEKEIQIYRLFLQKENVDTAPKL